MKNCNSVCDVCKVYCGGKDKLGKIIVLFLFFYFFFNAKIKRYFTVKHKRIHIIGDVKCDECNIRFTVKSLRYHQKRFHPSAKKFQPAIHVEYKCEICKLTCSDEKRLGK